MERLPQLLQFSFYLNLLESVEWGENPTGIFCDFSRAFKFNKNLGCHLHRVFFCVIKRALGGRNT